MSNNDGLHMTSEQAEKALADFNQQLLNQQAKLTIYDQRKRYATGYKSKHSGKML